MKEQEHDMVTDQGWAAMQRLLDQRMPRRRRRVAGWWWLAGLLLLPLIGVTGWQWYERSTETVPVPVVPTAPVAPMAERSPLSRQVTSADSGTITKPVVSQHLPLLQIQPRTTHGAGSLQAKVRPFWTEKAVFTAASTPQLALQAEGARAQDVINTPSGVINPAPVIPVTALTALPTPFSFPQVVDTLDFRKYPPYSSPEITRKLPRKATWSYGVLAGLNSERLLRVNGGVVGLVIDWQPLRRWGLRAGLQYAVQRLAIDESLVTVITEEAYESMSNSLGLFDNSGNFGNIGDFSSINTDILASVRRIHRIEAPLLAYWQPRRALRVYAGASLNHTFLAQTSSRILADNQIFKVATGRDEINRLATERLQTWQVKWQGGLGYRIGRRAEMNASIQTTFPKIPFRKKADLQADLKVADRQSSTFGQVRQLGVTLSGVVFF